MNIKAYHGTKRINSVQIVQNDFKPKKFIHNIQQRNDLPGDLGTGIYAFQDDPSLAMDFANKFNQKQDCSVIELDIEVDDEHVLDFDEEQNLNQFLEVKKRVMKLAMTYFKNCKGSRNCIDGIVAEILILRANVNAKVVKKRTYTPLLHEHLDTSRGGKIQPISNYYNGTEICIRDKGVITSKDILNLE